MSHCEFDEKFSELVREERRITNDILNMISCCEVSRDYLRLGHPSLFAWLVRGHGYSESSAYRRIEGARLLKAVPEVGRKLESGEVSLTQIAKVQSAARAQEKATRQKVTSADKSAAVTAVSGKSRLVGEQSLLKFFPAAQPSTSRDHSTAVDHETLRLSFNISQEVMNDLTRANEILSHAVPSGANGEILARLLKEFLKRKDPLKKIPIQRDDEELQAKFAVQ
jgi:hypothetical protein